MDGLSCPTDGLVGEYADIVAKNITLKNGDNTVTIDANGDGLSLDTTKYYTKEEVDDLVQNTGGGSSITVDTEITEDSENPVTSAAIYAALQSVEPQMTFEGMTEDVLFSNTSGVDSGTINLSKNLSDYDLMEIHFRNPNNTSDSIVSQMVLLSDFINYGRRAGGFGFDNFYRWIKYASDTSILIDTGSGYKVYKIIGVKFGRYVSGVAVDTTVTQSSNNPVTSGAVYTALQNIPSEDVYTLKTKSIGGIPSDNPHYIDQGQGYLGLMYERRFYKYNGIPALAGYYYNTTHGYYHYVLISLAESGVYSYCNASPSTIFMSYGTIYDDVNDVTWYYGETQYSYGAGLSANVPKIGDTGRYSNLLSAAQALLQQANVNFSSTIYEEDLFNPTDFTISSGDTIVSDKLMSLIVYTRPIKINGDTYYYIKTDNGIYYYEGANNTIEVNSKTFVITITPKINYGLITNAEIDTIVAGT